MKRLLIFQFLFFSLSFAKLQGIFIGAVPSNLLPPISLNTPQKYLNFVETSAEFAVNELNQNLKGKQNSLESVTSLPLQLRDINAEASQIGEAILVGALMEFDYGVRYQVKLAVPHHVQQGLLSLPSGEGDQNSLNFENPRFEAWNFSGPLEITFNSPRDDIKMRLPRDIETGAIRKINIEKDVNVNVNGLTSVKLIKPIEVELLSKQTKGVEELEVIWKQIPQLEFDGNLIFQSGLNIGNNFLIELDNRIKVKRISSLEVKFQNGTENPMKYNSLKRPSISLTKENPLTQYLEKVILQTKSISGSPNVRLRKIISASAEAVSLILMPVELISFDGILSNWNLVVTRDAKGKLNLFDFEQIQPKNAVSIDPSLTVNPNGTFFETLDRFAPFLQAGNSLQVADE